MTRTIALAVVGALICFGLGVLGQTLQGDNTHNVTTSSSSASAKITFSGFTFANIGGTLTANGMIGYCSDCLVQSSCAAGGTGAIAKRLANANVCN